MRLHRGDNGVGFDMAYADKLFGVFQRLHHVRAFTVETLRELGYDVLEARDGLNELNVLRQTPLGDIARLRSVLDAQDSSRHAN